MSDLNDAINDRLKSLRREYTAWRITFQDGERAAQAAYTRMRQLEAEVKRLKGLLNAYCGPGTAETMRRG